MPTSTAPSAHSAIFTFYPGETNRCPGCGRTHWYVGRTTAECGFCAAVLMIKDSSTSSTIIRRG